MPFSPADLGALERFGDALSRARRPVTDRPVVGVLALVPFDRKDGEADDGASLEGDHESLRRIRLDRERAPVLRRVSDLRADQQVRAVENVACSRASRVSSVVVEVMVADAERAAFRSPRAARIPGYAGPLRRVRGRSGGARNVSSYPAGRSGRSRAALRSSRPRPGCRLAGASSPATPVRAACERGLCPRAVPWDRAHAHGAIHRSTKPGSATCQTCDATGHEVGTRALHLHRQPREVPSLSLTRRQALIAAALALRGRARGGAFPRPAGVGRARTPPTARRGGDASALSTRPAHPSRLMPACRCFAPVATSSDRGRRRRRGRGPAAGRLSPAAGLQDHRRDRARRRR